MSMEEPKPAHVSGLPDIMTVTEVMKYLRILDRDTLYALIKNKKLKAFKIGSNYRFTTEAVRAFVNGGDIAQQEEAEQKRRNAIPEFLRVSKQRFHY